MWARIRQVPYVVLAALVLNACAGSSETRSSEGENDDGAGGSAGNGAGGVSRGGSGGTAGITGGSGGAAGDVAIGGTGGTISFGGSGGVPIGGTGGVISVGGMAGTTGELQHPFLACLLPVDGGMCTAAFERFFFNPATLACESFTWGGCGGNENRFETLEACEASCVAELPKECTPESRGPGCPCGPGIGDCSRTSCSSAPYELGLPCQPSETMLCSRGGAKGGCWCEPRSGQHGCGV